MVATVQTQAIQYANGVISLIQQLSAIDSQFKVLNNENTQLNLGTVLAAFATCATNADGSLGTADGSPSTAQGHVMDPRQQAQAGLTRAVSAYSVGVALTVLQQLDALLSGGAVSTQAAAPNILAQMVGG